LKEDVPTDYNKQRTAAKTIINRDLTPLYNNKNKLRKDYTKSHTKDDGFHTSILFRQTEIEYFFFYNTLCVLPLAKEKNRDIV